MRKQNSIPRRRAKPRRVKPDAHELLCDFCKKMYDRRDEAEGIYCCDRAEYFAMQYETFREHLDD